MEISLDIPQNQLFIRSIDARGVRVGDNYYNGPFILSSQQINPEWRVRDFDDIGKENLDAVFEMQPEVVLIGCGKKQVFLPPATQMFFFQRGIGFEVMTTAAACRTFNVLASEGRNVVAALLPENQAES